MKYIDQPMGAPDQTTVPCEMGRYLKRFAQERQRLRGCQQLLSNAELSTHICDRKRFPWHITASGIVFLAGKLLVIHHPHIKGWMPPGGHLEMQESPALAAIREVKEETGMDVELHEWHSTFLHPLDIDMHAVPANIGKGEPAHRHCDFRFLLKLLAAPCNCNELEYAWKSLDDLSFAGMDRIRMKLSEICSTPSVP